MCRVPCAVLLCDMFVFVFCAVVCYVRPTMKISHRLFVNEWTFVGRYGGPLPCWLSQDVDVAIPARLFP